MKKRIYYHDTDAGGVVYYANYLKYLEEARTEMLESKGLSIRQLHTEGFLYAVRKCSIVYKSPARYGDVIECDSTIREVTAAQILIDQTIRLADNNTLILTADISLVSLSKDFKATAIPDNIRELLI